MKVWARLRADPVALAAWLVAMAAAMVSVGVWAAPQQRAPHFEPQVRVRLGVDENGLDRVVTVPMERYVAGVLSGELLSDWPSACFQAQAIAARSYVVHQMMRSSGRAFDVESDDRDQVFLEGEPVARASEAARSTRGLVLTSNGQVLRAYYTSTCGGRAASARLIWPSSGSLSFNAAEPLNGHVRAHGCVDSPLYRWQRRRGTSELSERIRAWARHRGHAARRLVRLESISAVEWAPSGRPGSYELVDTQGRRVRLRADDLRVAMNYEGSAPLPRRLRIPSNDLEVEIVGERALVRGRGFGHGVGLCQYCAAAWAREGYAAEQMLSAFYPGAMLERLYDGGPASGTAQ